MFNYSEVYVPFTDEEVDDIQGWVKRVTSASHGREHYDHCQEILRWTVSVNQRRHKITELQERVVRLERYVNANLSGHLNEDGDQLLWQDYEDLILENENLRHSMVDALDSIKNDLLDIVKKPEDLLNCEGGECCK